MQINVRWILNDPLIRQTIPTTLLPIPNPLLRSLPPALDLPQQSHHFFRSLNFEQLELLRRCCSCRSEDRRIPKYSRRWHCALAALLFFCCARVDSRSRIFGRTGGRLTGVIRCLWVLSVCRDAWFWSHWELDSCPRGKVFIIADSVRKVWVLFRCVGLLAHVRKKGDFWLSRWP